MSESVDILIKAEDMATPVIAKSAKAVDGLDASVKRFKESGEKAKKSVEFFKVMANSLGGSEVGQYAQQLGELTEKTAQFAEVQKLGGAGAFAFKAGLVALAGVVAFRVGTAIGSAIFQTDKWTRALAAADEQAKRLNATLAKINAEQFAANKADIAIVSSTAEKADAYKKLLSTTAGNIKGVSDAVRRGEKDVEGWAASWARFGADMLSITGIDLTNNGQQRSKDQLENDRKRLEVLQDQARELDRMPRDAERESLGNARAYVKTLQDEVELLSVIEREREKIKALQAIAKSGVEQEEALKLVAEKQRLQVAELTRQEWKRLYLEAMQLEVGGKERADAIKYQDQGLAKAEAEKLAAEQARIDMRKQEGTKPLLQGKEERLLTRGTVDPLLQVNREQLVQLKKLNEPRSIGDILAEQEDYAVVK